MGRQGTSIKVNQFFGGFNTEANPLSFPDGASFDEQNLDLLTNGSRKRRNGFDTDLGSDVDTGIPAPSGDKLGKNQFLWRDAGGNLEEHFMVVQIGNYIGIHSMDTTVISSNLSFQYVIPDADPSVNYGIASVGGTLVITTGQDKVYSIEYDGTDFEVDSNVLLVRDFFGVEYEGYTEAQNLQKRPPNLTNTHLYNLRNQTFALPRVDGANNTTNNIDPIREFRLQFNVSPSNADNLTLYLVADPNKDSNRTVERFNKFSMFFNPPQNNKAPTGYFIINALDRGASREEEFERLTSRFADLQWRSTVSLPADRTTKGASVVAEYAGRVWYAGFGNDVVDGDNKSPKMGSYILFSQIVKEPSQIYQCYQEADPTSHIDPDLVSTDGGFIKIDGAYGIKSMVPIGSSLFVFAENGVWRVVGKDENTFDAISYAVIKISDEGCVSGNSVVDIDGSLVYWSNSDIFAITRDRFGDWNVENITENTIRTFYQNLSSLEIQTVSGYYDNTSSTVRWLYGEDVGNRSEVNELILNKKFQVFTKNKIPLPSNIAGPISVSGGKFQGNAELPVTVDGILVTVDGEIVTSPSKYYNLSASQNFYCILVELDPTIRYTFGGYNNVESTYDWVSISSIDSPAFIVTGFSTGGDGRLRKDVPYITTYYEKTEPLDSSCYLQTRWNWNDTPLGGKWSAPRQSYREIVAREGDTVVKTRNKIRGGGHSVGISFSSEPGRTLHLFGWEHNLNATTNE